MSRIPDRTLALVRQGYDFGRRECARRGADAVSVRVLGTPITLLRGPRSAEVFHSDRLVRTGALPRRVQRTLVGSDTVQNLDGPPHHARKALFLDLLGPQRVPELVGLFTAEWRRRLPSWERQGRIVLYDEVAEILCTSAAAFAGVPLAERDVPRRTAQLHALIEGAGAIGPRHWRGRLARVQAERWAGELVDGVRSGRLCPPTGSALAAWSEHRDLGGLRLSRRAAGSELLNVVRPTIAIDRFIVFAALALHEHPHWQQRLRAGDDDEVQRFVQEVRRTTPFFPAIAGLAAGPFSVQGEDVPEGRLVVLDLHGTNHDPDAWPDPDRFDPDRFLTRDPGAYDLVPQGGGDHASGHRCPGEWIVTGLMSAAVRLLTGEMIYHVPPQDLSVRRNRVPAMPRSRLLIDGIRPAR